MKEEEEIMLKKKKTKQTMIFTNCNLFGEKYGQNMQRKYHMPLGIRIENAFLLLYRMHATTITVN